MCKVTIKKVEKIYPSVSGARKDGSEWRLHIFDCLVSVDGDKRSAVRSVKTFVPELAQKIAQLDDGANEVFEADKEPVGKSFEYLVKHPKKSYRGKRGGQDQPYGPTNRQQALKVAVDLAAARASREGDVPTAGDILKEADELLSWLEGGAQ